MTDDPMYLKHILDAIEKIESYILVGRDIFHFLLAGCCNPTAQNHRRSDQKTLAKHTLSVP